MRPLAFVARQKSDETAAGVAEMTRTDEDWTRGRTPDFPKRAERIA